MSMVLFVEWLIKSIRFPSITLTVVGTTTLPIINNLASSHQYQQSRWASKKQGGSTQNNKDSNPKYLGVKLYGGQHCIPGNIIVRQRGTKFHPGKNVGMGKDHTIYSLVEGNIQFFHDKRRKRTYINVEPPAILTNQQLAWMNVYILYLYAVNEWCIVWFAVLIPPARAEPASWFAATWLHS